MNAGLFALTGGRNLTTLGALSNSGLLFIGFDSTLSATGDYTQTEGGFTYLDFGTLTAGCVVNGGYLAGSGIINGHVENAGWLEVGGAGVAGYLRINGDYRQTAEGLLNPEVSDVAAGEYDWFDISGTATLEGVINVDLLGGIAITAEDFIAVLTYCSRDMDRAPTVIVPETLDFVLDEFGLTLSLRR